MSETYKSQNYVDMLLSICPEMCNSPPGSLNSKVVPNLKNVILISQKTAKYLKYFITLISCMVNQI